MADGEAPKEGMKIDAAPVDAGTVIAALEPLLLPRRIARMQSVLATRSDHVAFVFERMVDPHNLSAALRSLDAFSFQDAYLVHPQERIDLARGITQGTERWISLHESASQAECVAGLREKGYRVLASHLGEAETVELTEIDFRQRVALIFGNEHRGVSDEMLTLADGSFRIEMMGFVASLNLSVAAALSAHHARREIDRLGREANDSAPYLLPEVRRREIYANWLRHSVRRAEEILADL